MLMKCRYRITQDGFKFQKLIGSRTIPFEEIKSIHLQEDCFALTTNDGEEFRTVENNLLTLLEAVVRHNISYLDETDHEEKYYTREELKPLIEDATKAALEVANEYVKEHLGPEYHVDTKLLETPGEINLYFILLCKGHAVTTLPPAAREADPKDMPGSFDCMALAWLHEWDSSGRFARYGIVNELKDLKICRKTQRESMEYIVKIIKGK